MDFVRSPLKKWSNRPHRDFNFCAVRGPSDLFTKRMNMRWRKTVAVGGELNFWGRKGAVIENANMGWFLGREIQSGSFSL